jgi:hypothetical protein
MKKIPCFAESFVFYVDLGTIGDYFRVEHYSIDFYIRDGVCVLRRYEMNI